LARPSLGSWRLSGRLYRCKGVHIVAGICLAIQKKGMVALGLEGTGYAARNTRSVLNYNAWISSPEPVGNGDEKKQGSGAQGEYVLELLQRGVQ